MGGRSRKAPLATASSGHCGDQKCHYKISDRGLESLRSPACPLSDFSTLAPPSPESRLPFVAVARLRDFVGPRSYPIFPIVTGEQRKTRASRGLPIVTGQKFIKVAKSPMSPAVAFPFIVESSGISLLNDDGFKVMGREISTICCQGPLSK